MPDRPGDLSISVDRARCMGSGMCVMYAPATFGHDDHTKAVVLDAAGDPIESIRTAVEACPTGAITVLTDPEGA
ncbi:MAG TPA: ferredoxin [Acidimicrobiales bacterium]|nr:ferredoxin [Acidimicrobiales bacterium]